LVPIRDYQAFEAAVGQRSPEKVSKSIKCRILYGASVSRYRCLGVQTVTAETDGVAPEFVRRFHLGSKPQDR